MKKTIKSKSLLKILTDWKNSLQDLTRYLEWEILDIIGKCEYYSYDSEACETYCTHPKVIKRLGHNKEFEPTVECPDCKFRKEKKK